MTDPVYVIGATGRFGQGFMRLLAERGVACIAVVRNAEKWKAAGIAGELRAADLADGAALKSALGGAKRIVSCAHARHAAAIIAAAPPEARLVLLGSTRRYTRWPDDHGNGVLEGERALLASGRNGVMLHPTMIYGTQGENNVRRLAKLLRRLPLIPLPGGGKSLVQPIYQEDLARCALAALAVAWKEPQTVVVAGPAPVTYADFARAVAFAAGLPPPRIVRVPAGLLMALAPLAAIVPGIPAIEPAAIRRLLEDKAFPIDAMIATLGVKPRALEEGLALTFRRPS